MSGLLAGQVWDSDLDPRLKPLAAVLANFGKDDGTSIFPSVEYLCWLLKRSRRYVQRGLSTLKELGVLIPVSSVHGGRGKTTVYFMNVAALPTRPPWSRPKARHP